jgi:hypothetical protein
MELEGSLPLSQEPPRVHILNQTNPVHATPLYLFKIHLKIIHPLMSWSS